MDWHAIVGAACPAQQHHPAQHLQHCGGAGGVKREPGEIQARAAASARTAPGQSPDRARDSAPTEIRRPTIQKRSPRRITFLMLGRLISVGALSRALSGLCPGAVRALSPCSLLVNFFVIPIVPQRTPPCRKLSAIPTAESTRGAQANDIPVVFSQNPLTPYRILTSKYPGTQH